MSRRSQSRPRSICVPLALICLTLPAAADAGETAAVGPPSVGPVAPTDDVLDPLDTPDGALPVDPPWSPVPGFDSDQRPQQLGDKILYVNFDGADMNGCGFGSNDPANNCSSIFQGNVLPYSGDAAKRASIIQIVRKRVEDFGITVTNQRPASGDYDMEMVGNWQGQNPGFAGVAPSIDCWDNDGGEVSFTLEKSGSADGIAEIILQEVAHTWGLEHIDDSTDLLYPTTEGTNKTFTDQCLKIVDDTQLNPSNGICNSVHTNFCNSGWQNSYQDLLLVFGESVPDTLAPLVAITSPSDGATIDGGDVDLVVSFEDDQSPAVVNATITMESAALPEPIQHAGAYASPDEITFPITGLPDGSYTVRVDATDESDNPASDEISFTISGGTPSGDTTGADSGADTGAGDTGGTSGGDASGGDTGAGDGDGSGDDGNDTPGQMMGETADEGCGCTAVPRAPWLGLGVIVLLALGTRRRRL